MKKTALSIIQSVCYRINQSAPTALVGETVPSTLQWINLLYQVCEELRQVGVWAQQKRTHEFDTVSSQEGYQLPDDFYSPCFSTYWNQDEEQQLIGPLSDAQYEWQVQASADSPTKYSFRVFGWDNAAASSTTGQFKLNPTPSSAQTLSFNYLTRHMFLPVEYALSTAYAQNALVNVSGEIYKCATAITASDTVPTGKTTGIVDDDGTWDWYNTPMEALQADTDVCLFDYDLVALGLEAKWKQQQGGDWQPIEQNYRSKIDTAIARYRGPYKGSMARHSAYPTYRVQYRGWSI